MLEWTQSCWVLHSYFSRIFLHEISIKADALLNGCFPVKERHEIIDTFGGWIQKSKNKVGGWFFCRLKEQHLCVKQWGKLALSHDLDLISCVYSAWLFIQLNKTTMSSQTSYAIDQRRNPSKKITVFNSSTENREQFKVIFFPYKVLSD